VRTLNLVLRDPRTPDSSGGGRKPFGQGTTGLGSLAVDLLDYAIRVDSDANDRYGAFKVGTHDDLVTAFGLAAQDRQRSFSFGRACPRPTR